MVEQAEAWRLVRGRRSVSAPVLCALDGKGKGVSEVGMEAEGVRWFVRVAGVVHEFDTEREAFDFLNEYVDVWRVRDAR